MYSKIKCNVNFISKTVIKHYQNTIISIGNSNKCNVSQYRHYVCE